MFSYAGNNCAPYCNGEWWLCINYNPPTDSSNFSTIHWRSDANITHMNKALQSFSVLLFFYCLFVCDNHPVPTTTSADTCPTIRKLTPLCKVGSFTKSVVTVVCKTCHWGLSSLCNISYMHQLNEPATLQGEQGTYIHQLWITHPMDNISWMPWATSGVNELHHFTSHSSHCTVDGLLGGLITPRQQGQRSKVKDGQATLGYSQGRHCVLSGGSQDCFYDPMHARTVTSDVSHWQHASQGNHEHFKLIWCSMPPVNCGTIPLFPFVLGQ